MNFTDFRWCGFWCNFIGKKRTSSDISSRMYVSIGKKKRLASYSDEDWERKISMLKALDFEKLVVFLNKLKGNL